MIMRVFLKPDGAKFMDFLCPDGQMGQGFMQALRDGWLTGDLGMVPLSSVHAIFAVQNNDQKTNLTVFPGGKGPNGQDA